MNPDNPVVYDPSPTDIELQAWENIGVEKMDISELAKPEVVQLLVHSLRMNLSKLKASENEIRNLRNDNTNLREERENLKIKIAKFQERIKSTWLQIPISLLGGFALNILVKDFKDGIGWILLIFCFIMLVFLRGSDVFKSQN